MPKFKKKANLQEKSKHDRLSNETVDYYKRVYQTFSEGFSDGDEKDIFLKNVFTQLEEDGVRPCFLASTSRILQSLITESSPSHTACLFKIFRNDWDSLITNIYASHVAQDLINQVPKWMNHTEATGTELDEDDDNVCTMFCELCVLVADNLDKYITDTHASHILRTCFEVLGGCAVQNQLIRERRSGTKKTKEGDDSKTFPSFSAPEKFQKYLKRFAKHIFSLQNIKGLLCDRTATLVIQTLLLVLHQSNDSLCQKYVTKVLELTGLLQTSGSEDLLVMVKDETASFMVEQILTMASKDTFNTIYKTVFRGKLLIFALHPIANFILQRLISHVQDKELFEEIFSKLSENIEDILAFNHMGLIIRIAETCQRLRCRQEKLVRCLMTAFHCEEPIERQSKLVPLIASLTTYEVFFNTEDEGGSKDEQKEDNNPGILSSINYHGALLLQHLLQFGNPRLVVSSMVELKPTELKTMSCDRCGSHVMDAFFESSSIGEKGKEQMICRLKGTYKDLACDQHGSRTLETIWRTATLKQKTMISEELAKQEHKIRTDKFGFHIHRNFALFHFVNRRKEWIDMQTSDRKKRKIFSDFLGESDVKSKKQKTAEHRKAGKGDRQQPSQDSQLEKTTDERKWQSKRKQKDFHPGKGKKFKKKQWKMNSS